MATNPIVSREEWLQARKAHLASEKALTRMRDQVAEERRRLPWVRVTENYVFDTPQGPRTLADLFDGRGQLYVYHFMLTPGSDHLCPGCSFLADHFDAARRHFEHADLSLAVISRAPLAQILPVKERMGWTFDWVSSHGTSFNYDYGVSFTPEQVASGATGYNYGTTPYAARTSTAAASSPGTTPGRCSTPTPPTRGATRRCSARSPSSTSSPRAERAGDHELGPPARRVRGRRAPPCRYRMLR
jgi:predicted dithiol-disulfide oxidoreductase (DUF899 family)